MFRDISDAQGDAQPSFKASGFGLGRCPKYNTLWIFCDLIERDLVTPTSSTSQATIAPRSSASIPVLLQAQACQPQRHLHHFEYVTLFFNPKHKNLCSALSWPIRSKGADIWHHTSTPSHDITTHSSDTQSGSEYRSPNTAVIIGGIVSALFGILFLVR